MKQFLVLALVLFAACSTPPGKPEAPLSKPEDPAGKLEDKKQTLQLEFVAWSCACANWATPLDIDRYHDTGALADHCVFIESARKELALPDTLGYSGDIIAFTGQFYKEKGYPNDYVKSEEHLDKARIFRYTGFKIVRSNHREFTKVQK